jgi:hypothetical protein
VVIFITLLARFVPLLQVTFFALLEDFYPGRLAVKDWDKTQGSRVVVAISLFQSQIDLIWVIMGISSWFDRSD